MYNLQLNGADLSAIVLSLCKLHAGMADQDGQSADTDLVALLLLRVIEGARDYQFPPFVLDRARTVLRTVNLGG